jgi:MFS family permease
MREVLSRPGLRLLFAGETSNSFGDWMLLLVLGIWVKSLTGSNGLAGGVLLAMAAPSVISPVFGWVVDRFRRRRFLIAVNLLSALALTPLLLVSRASQVWVIYVVAVLYGISFTISGGAFSGLIKEMVPDQLLGAANGAFGSMRQLLRLIGPLAGAGLFAAVGPHSVVLIDIVSFLIAAAALAGIRLAELRPERTERHWLHEVSAGARHLLSDPPIRRATAAIAIGMLALGAVDTVVFAFVDQGLHKPPTFLSLLITVQGIGAIIGALFASKAMSRLGEPAVIAIALAAFGIAIGVNVVPSVPLALASMPFAGVGNAVGFVAFSTLLQRRTAGPLIGRVSAASDVAIGGAQTVSMATGATLIGFVDFRVMFAVIAEALLVCAGTLAWTSRHDPVERAGSGRDSTEPAPLADEIAGPVTPPELAAR